MKKIIILIFACLYACASFAYTERNLLVKQADINSLKNMLVQNQQWVTYPDYADRAAWDDFWEHSRRNTSVGAKKTPDYQWQVMKATDYLAFERTGTIMEKAFQDNNKAIVDLLMAELAEGKGRFLDPLINGVWYTCEMTSWASPAHLLNHPAPHSMPIYDYPLIDLVAADLGGLLSWTYYFLHESFDKVNPEISRRLRHELQVRILDPYLNNDSFWWMGRNYKGRVLNNWTPWCNCNVLMSFMLLEENRDTLAKAVYLTMESVDKFLNYIKGDGACEEGPSYWGHAAGRLLDYLELLSAATGGKITLFQNPMIRNMGEYISRSYIGNGWVVNFADASARGGGDAYLIYRFGKAIGSDELKGFAALMRKEDPLPWNKRDVFRTLASIAIDKELQAFEPKHVTRPFTWYPETEFCYLTNREGVFLAAKGGYNDESHNHNDAGTCSVWFNQTPVLIDAGVGTYTKKTFSKERYTIWTMQSNYHNLPMINGVPEKYGRKYKATEVKASKTGFSSNIATAYPEEAKVKKWIRSYGVKGKQVQIKDAFELEETVAANVVNFMTWGNLDSSEKGKVRIRVKEVEAVLLYDANKFDLKIETVDLKDPPLVKVWGDQIYRLSFTAKQQVGKGNYSFTLKNL